MTSERCQRDAGATLVTFALLMVVIFTFVAFAIDLGFGRSDRRTSRSLSDPAAVSAGYHMAGNADPNPFNPIADPVAACRAAIESVRTNTSDFDPVPSASDGCNKFATCDAVDRYLEISDVPWALTIEHPVPDASITDANFAGDGLTDEDGDPCERMRVSLDHSRDTYFAGVIGVSEVKTGGTAVVVGKIPDPSSRVVPAFLMLDRTVCQAIWTNVGQGTVAPDPSLLYGDGILVRKGSDGQPGFVHTDSDATDCGNGANEYAVYANEPAGGTDTLVVEPGVDADGNAASGVIESTATNGRSGAGGTNVTVSVGEVVGRTPVDEIYQQAVTELHNTYAYPAVSATGPPASSAANPVITFDCTGTPSATPPTDGSTWTAYVACIGPGPNSAFSNNLSIDATSVVFASNVSVGNNTLISLSGATDVTIRGSLTVGEGGRLNLPAAQNVYVGSRFDNSGSTGINAVFDTAAATGATNPRCNAGGKGPDPTNTVRFVIFSPSSGPSQENPALASSGLLAMCQTTVYLAGERNDTVYDEQSIEGTTSCSEAFPCPELTNNTIRGARFQLSGEVRWFAPNQSSSALTSSMPLPLSGGIEDLAAWAEGGGSTNATAASSVGGGGTRFTYSGIFFTPNSKISLSAGNASTGPVDAQFIARAIQVNGGRFEMQPARQNSVPVPVRGSFQLIR